MTGATGGRQGSTGLRVARLLLERKVPVRAMVRRLDERADAIRGFGAEVVQGDLLDYPTVRRAMEGTRRAFFTFPVEDGLLDATAIFAAAARDAGVELIANVSQFRPTPDAPTPRLRQHWFSEQVFDWADVGAVHLRAPPFYENLRALAAETVAGRGIMALPWGPGPAVIPLVGAVDVARVAAGVLIDPAKPPRGHAIYLLAELLTVDEIVATLIRALGRPVRYVEITDEQWRQAVAGRIQGHALEHLAHLWQFFRSPGVKKGEAPYRLTDTIERIGGAPPQSLEAFVREDAASWQAPPPAP